MSNPFSTLKGQIKERSKLLHTACIDFAVVAVGINATQTGPALLDLQIISHTNTEEASAFLTAASVGCVIGSLAMGSIHGRWDKHLIMCLLLLGTSVSVTALPWCSPYVLMILMHGVMSMFRAAFNTVATVETIRTWAPNSRLWLQMFNLSFSIGGIISPLITKPFLAPKQANNTAYDFQKSANLPSQNLTNIQPETHVQYAYLIPGVWFAVAVVIFLVKYCYKEDENQKPSSGDYTSLEAPLSRTVLYGTIVLLCLMFFFSVSVQTSLAAFLMTFGVIALDWRKADGANLTTVYWVCHASSRLFAIFYTNFVSPIRILIVTGVLTLVVLILMIFSSLYSFDDGIWICTGIIGFCVSAQIPALYMWIEERIMRNTPRMVSFFNFSITIPGMVNPLIIGYLMQEVSAMWFLYLLIIHCIMFLVSILVMSLWARLVVQPQRNSL